MDKAANNSDSPTAIEKAAEMAGGASKLATGVNQVLLPMPATTPKTKAHVGKWLERGECPPDMAIRIEAVTEGGVTRHELRPDVFGFEPIAVPDKAQVPT